MREKHVSATSKPLPDTPQRYVVNPLCTVKVDLPGIHICCSYKSRAVCLKLILARPVFPVVAILDE